MKKILIFLLLTAGMANAQIVNIPDANFKAKLIALGVDTDSDGEIQQSEALMVNSLDLTDASISDLTGIQSFAMLAFLICDNNQISFLDVSNMINLGLLSCINNNLVELKVTGTSMQSLVCNKNNLIDIDLTGLSFLLRLDCSENNMQPQLNLSGAPNINDLNCYRNNLTSLDVSGLANLIRLECSNNNIGTLTIGTLANIESIKCSYNALTSLNIANLTTLDRLECSNNQLTAINLTGLPNLTHFDCSSNQITAIDISGLTSMDYFFCFNNDLTTIDVTGLNALKYLTIDGNQLTNLNVTSLPGLLGISCAFNQLTSLDVSTLTNLQNLNCSSNTITSLDLTNNVNLTYLNCSINQLTALTVSHLTQLRMLICGNNSIPNLDFSGLTELVQLFVDSTGRTSLDVSNQPLLTNLFVVNNPISVVDVSNLQYLDILSFGGNSLTQVFMKNGSTQQLSLPIQSPNLQFVCADEQELNYVTQTVGLSGAPNATYTSYCTFTPGGDYNTITGNSRFDLNNNGCDALDIPSANLKYSINNQATTEISVVNGAAQYAFYVGAGDFTVTPQLENPNYFTVSPASVDFNFAAVDNSTQTQDFCLTPNGMHPDLEIVMMPLNEARPGFDAHYTIAYKNKGNQMLSGNINLIFDDSRLDLVSAIPGFSNQATNGLTWNYVDLKPLETRSIDLLLNVNTPLENPAVNNGDTLSFTAAINPLAGDDVPEDNIFELNQIVVNSFDPNDKTCLEGDSISPQQIGKYLHYVINFENLGTAEATNVVVKDIIDTSKFDINSLQVIHASDNVITKIKGNVVEFVFQGINLAPIAGDPPVGGHGSILFKIKTLSTLAVGDEVSNMASIYFDYNAPIETNFARTVFAALTTEGFTKDESIVLYPNPAKDFVKIKCDSAIKSIELYDIQGRILETILNHKNAAELDIANKSKGIYFVKVTTEKGKTVEKIIKE